VGVITVDLGERSYAIEIENGLAGRLGERISALGLWGKAAVVTNPRVGALYAKKVMDGLEQAGFEAVLIEIPDGEEHKTLEEAARVYDRLIEFRMERRDAIVALGGGVIGDMAGFIAATYLRGVPYIQVPTTLLSQVDSSVGGKTAVNHPKGKNLIGAFYQPAAVFIDPEALSTLDEREMRAGLAEVVKYGVIRDAGFFGFLEGHAAELLSPGPALVSAIERSCAIKAAVVAADETEAGLRSILNFGHTFGHAVEAATDYGAFRHGEAVAMGMSAAAGLSAGLGLCAAEVSSRLRSLLSALGLPVSMPDLPPSALVEAMLLDKKVSGGRIRMVLATEIGSVVTREVGRAEIERFLG